MQTYAINPNKKSVIFFTENQFQRSYFEMSLTDDQYKKLLNFNSELVWYCMAEFINKK